MQMLALALIFGLFLHDALVQSMQQPPTGLPEGRALALVLIPRLIMVVLYALCCRWAARSLGKPSGRRHLRALERVGRVYTVMAGAFYALDLAAGVLTTTRHTLGDWVLLDELVFLLPTLAMMAAGWLAYYPVDRRMREAALMRRLDTSEPVRPWSRWQFVITQFRHQVLLVLLPLLLIWAWAETLSLYPPGRWSVLGWPIEMSVPLTLLGVAVVFVMSPVLIRMVWDTVRLPAGPMRDGLTELCKEHRVGVRELLLWRTYGNVVNAAVMGLIAPVRYILLTDGLLERMSKEQVEAVMAHEIAHVKKKHLFWLIAVAGSLLTVLQLFWAVVVMFGINALLPLGPADRGHQFAAAPASQASWIESGLDLLLGGLLGGQGPVLLSTGLAVVSWAWVFGWVSRRFERQADTFAVQHLAAKHERRIDTQGRLLIDDESVRVMTEALGQVAVLNHMPTARKNWRHGSIAWRQVYLRSLVGQRTDQLAIDRLVGVIKIIGGLLLLAVVGMQLAMAAGLLAVPV